MAKSNEEQIEKRVEEQIGEQTEGNIGEHIEKDTEKDMYRPKSRMDQLQEEFHMSDSEVEGLTKFITSSKNISASEILEEMIKCESLNIRQKVAFAHVLGIFVTEETMSIRIRSSQD